MLDFYPFTASLGSFNEDYDSSFDILEQFMGSDLHVASFKRLAGSVVLALLESTAINGSQ